MPFKDTGLWLKRDPAKVAGAEDILFLKRCLSRQPPEVSHTLPEKNAVHTSISQSQTVCLRLESILILQGEARDFFSDQKNANSIYH